MHGAIDAERLEKLIGMLGSSHEGEVAAAAAAISRMLTAHGLTWHDLGQAAGAALAGDTPRPQSQPFSAAGSGQPHPKGHSFRDTMDRFGARAALYELITAATIAPSDRRFVERAADGLAEQPEKGLPRTAVIMLENIWYRCFNTTVRYG